MHSRAQAKTLENGLKVIVHEDHSNPLLCLQLYIRIGSIWERKGEEGYSHFIEHLVFKSTHNFGYNEISRTINELGGSINAYTDFDSTCIYIILPAEYLDQGLRILAELAFSPTFTSEDVALEKDIICEEIRQTKSDPELDFFEYIQSNCFIDNPQSRPVLGSLASVKAATQKKLKAFHARHYTPQNSFLVLAGDLDTAQTMEKVQAYWSQWISSQALSKPDYSRFWEPEPVPAPSFCRKNRMELLAFALPELCSSHPQCDALQIALRCLAYGNYSRLYKRLVEEEKIASSVKVESISGSLSGYAPVVISSVNSKHILRISEIFAQEYQSILRDELDDKEIYLAKRDIINGWRYGFQGVENIASMIGNDELMGSYETIYDYDQRVMAITRAEILAAVRGYWHPSHLIVFHQGPKPHLINISEFLRPSLQQENQVMVWEAAQDIPHSPVSQLSSQPLTEFRPGYFSARLSNGLSFIYHYLPDLTVCGYALSTNFSQLSESPVQRGLNFFCSTAMLHATQKHSFNQLIDLSRDIGFNVRTENPLDSTIFRGKCFPRDLETAVSVLAEIICEPAFDSDYIRVCKMSALDILRREKQNPSSKAYQSWFKMLFGDRSPYDKCTGEPSDIRRISKTALSGWHAEKYCSSRSSIGLVGSVDPDRVWALIDHYFSAYPMGNHELETPPALQPSSTKRIAIQRTGMGQAIINLGGFAPPASNRLHTTAFHVLAQIMGGDMDSRFFNILREKHGLAYQTGFDFSSVNELGFWNAYAYCDPHDYRACLGLLREILDQVENEGVSESELQLAKNYLCGMHRIEMENVSVQAAMISNLDVLCYEPEFFLDREQRIHAVRMETINELASLWLSEGNQYTHILL